MSKLACRLIKCKQPDIKGIEIHNERKSENSKNKDIDYRRTKDNYDVLGLENVNYLHRVKEIAGDKKYRKDAVKLVSVVVTAEKAFFDELGPDRTRQFFKTSATYLSDQFGAGNIVAAKVHVDEHTPHMHLDFVPMTEDGRLCAKEIITRQALKNLQEEMPKYLQQQGFKIERGEPLSQAKHVETIEFKRQQLQAESKKLEKQLKDLKKTEQALLLCTTEQKQQMVNAAMKDAKREKVLGLMDTGKVVLAEKHYKNLCLIAKSAVVQAMDRAAADKWKTQVIEDLKKDKQVLQERLRPFERIERSIEQVQDFTVLEKITLYAEKKARESKDQEILERENRNRKISLAIERKRKMANALEKGR